MNPQLQEKLNREKAKIKAEQVKAENVLSLFPFELKSIEEVKSKLSQEKMSFYDITFSP